jgi:hypothetical protein
VVRRSPGGVGDGLPAMPDGEPLLARWFVLSMFVLSIAGIGLTVYALSQRVEPPAEAFPAAERRNPGTAEVTHERGQIVVAQDTTAETPVTCAPNVRLVGDAGGRATLRRAFGVVCQQLADDDDGSLAAVAAGLRTLDAERGIARVAQAVATGIDSSARVEEGALVVEIAPKFQFDNAREAAPFLAHELAHIGGGTWPGAPVDAAGELDAMAVQLELCEDLRLPGELPRGCNDAAELLADDASLDALRGVGYPG